MTVSASSVLTGDVSVGATARGGRRPGDRVARRAGRRPPDARPCRGGSRARSTGCGWSRPPRRSPRARGRCWCARAAGEVPADRRPRTAGSRFPAVTTDRLAVVVTGSDSGGRRSARRGLAGAGGRRRGRGARAGRPADAGGRHRRLPRRAAAGRRCRWTASPTRRRCRARSRTSGRDGPLPVTVCDDFADRVGAAAGRGAPAAYRAVRVVRDRHGGVDAGRDVGGAGRHPSGHRARGGTSRTGR